MTVYLNLHHGSSIEDRIIQAVQAERYPLPHCRITHVSLLRCLDGADGHAEVVEAMPPRVHHVEPTDHYWASVVGCYALPLGEDEADRVWDAALSHVGELYDFPGLAAAALWCMLGMPEKFYGSGHARFYCSELAICCLRVAMTVLPGLDADDTTPAALSQWAAQTLTVDPSPAAATA